MNSVLIKIGSHLARAIDIVIFLKIKLGLIKSFTVDMVRGECMGSIDLKATQNNGTSIEQVEVSKQLLRLFEPDFAVKQCQTKVNCVCRTKGVSRFCKCTPRIVRIEISME